MSYVVNKTNGNIVAVVEDGTTDTISSSITLVGKGTSNYGEYIAENSIKMLENFATDTAPAHPITGQLWYNTATSNITAYNGTTWEIPVPQTFYSTASNTTGTGSITVTNNSGITIGAASTAQLAVESGSVVLKTNASVNAMTINPATGAITVAASPTGALGIATKQYVDTLTSVGPDTDNKATVDTNSLTVILNGETIISADDTGATLSGASYVSNTPATETNDLQIASTAFVQNNKVSPAFTGTPTAPTAALGTNTTQLASTAFVKARSDADKISPAFTGTPTAPTATAGTNTTQLASTGFVTTAINTFSNAVSTTYAPLNTPAFIGVPTAPTAVVSTNTTQLATTAFVQNNKASPVFSGTPTVPTAVAGTSTTQIASTSYVMTATEKWGGSRKFISTLDPIPAQGTDGDFWFKIL
jgi:hypothetical protein